MRVEICWQSVLQIAAVFSCICLFIPDSWQPWCILGAGAGESVICHRNEAWAFTGPGEQAAADANTGINLYCGPLTTDLQISTQSICIFQWQILTFLHLFSPSKKTVTSTLSNICFILRHWEIMYRNESRCIICIFMLFVWMCQIYLFQFKSPTEAKTICFPICQLFC